MELSYGNVITKELAGALGVLDTAEGLVRDGPDQPWEVITPADVPVVQSGGGAKSTTVPGELMAEEKQSAAHVSLYRAMHHLNKGGLHRALGVPEGSSIPAEKLEAAKNSTNPHVAKMAHFAATMGGFHHK